MPDTIVETDQSELALVLQALRMLPERDHILTTNYFARLHDHLAQIQNEFKREHLASLRRVDSLRHIQKAHAKAKRRMKTLREDNYALRARLNGLARKYHFDV